MPRIIKRRDWPGWGFKEEWPRYGLGIEWPAVGPIPARDIEREIIYSQIVVPVPEPEPTSTGGTAPTRHVVSVLTPNSLGPGVDQATGDTMASTVYPSSNRAIFVPFTLDDPFTVVKMGVVNGATASGNVDLGIYDQDFTRVVSTGSTAQSGTNAVQEFNVTDTLLSPGWYYLAIAADNTTATYFAVDPANFNSWQGMAGCAQMASAFPLPATATPAAVSSNYLPWIAATSRVLYA